MKLLNIISELDLNFRTYSAMVKIRYKEGPTVEDVAELVRAASGVTRVTTGGGDIRKNVTTLKLKIVSKKSPVEAFKALRERVLKKIPIVTGFDVAEKTITIE